MKKCPFCGTELKDDSLFCTECGKELPKAIECPHCGAPVNEGDVFCMECGKKIDAAQTEKTDEVFVTKECPHCGATIREDAHFCPNCDKYIEEAPAESTTEVYEPIKKECPHCGALIEENDVRCDSCGKLLIEGVEDEYEEKNLSDYKIPIIGGIFIVLFLGACWWYYSSSSIRVAKERVIADSLEMVRQDSIHKADSIKKVELQATETELQIASCKGFLEKFYNGLDNAEDKNDYIRKYVTPKAQAFLRDEYGDFSDSDSLAIWMFSHETSSDITGPKNRIIEVIDKNTYKVISTDGEDEYQVTIGIVKEGNFYKIDTIEDYIDNIK